MTSIVETASIPSPEAVAKKQLARAPVWLQRFTSNTLALTAWIGLPSTLLSTLSNMQFVLDSALWLYRHAGALRPFLLGAGEGISFVVGLWRSLTHPIWEALFGWLHVSLPAWAPDALTLLLLFGVGVLRRGINVVWSTRLSGGLMYRDRRDTKAGFSANDRQPIPRSFPYKEHFEEYGFMLPLRRLADTQRLWRKWRGWQIGSALRAEPQHWPRFSEEVTRAQFGRYWLGIMDGRRAMLIYGCSAAIVAVAFGADWAYRVGLFR